MFASTEIEEFWSTDEHVLAQQTVLRAIWRDIMSLNKVDKRKKKEEDRERRELCKVVMPRRLRMVAKFSLFSLSLLLSIKPLAQTHIHTSPPKQPCK